MGTKLLAWRRDSSFGPIEAAVLLLYSAVLAFAIRVHEPWGDEAQAWLLARNNTFGDLVLHRLHYEGAPALWHILLRLFALCHGTWSGVNVFAALFAIAGVYVLLRWSPFPPIVRWLLPFTFFLQYQYAAIARSYVLFALLLFSLCALWPAREQRPLTFAIVAGLLANLSFQGFIVAGVLIIRAVWMYLRQRRGSRAPRNRRFVTATLAFGSMCACAIYVAAPAPDVNFAVSDQVSDGLTHRLLLRVFGEMPLKTPLPLPAAADEAPSAKLVQAPRIRPAHPRFEDSPARWVAWQSWQRPNTAVVGSAPNILLEHILFILDQATWPIARSNILAIAFMVTLILWMRSRRAATHLLPWLAILIFGDIIWVADHHLGMIFIAILAAIWLTAGSTRATRPRAEQAFLALFTLVIVLQIGWTISCVRRDARGSYDPGPATARYLHSRSSGERWAAFHFHSTSVQPYFDRNPFFNLDAPYWIWSGNVEPDRYFRNVVADSPDLVLISREDPGHEPMRDQWVPLNQPNEIHTDFIEQYMLTRGYRVTHQFCGERFARLGSSFKVCNDILEPYAYPKPSLLAQSRFNNKRSQKN